MPDLSVLTPWQWALAAAGILVVLAHYKTSRADGVFVKRVHPYRRLMWFVMPTRNECVVYYEDKMRAEKLLEYLEKAKPSLGCNITHAYVAALNVAIAESPTMDQFVIGRRLYKRKERSITFSMKRKAMDKKAKLAVVRMPMRDDESFASLADRINNSIGHQRSGKKTHADKEYQLFDMLPRTFCASLFGSSTRWTTSISCLMRSPKKTRCTPALSSPILGHSVWMRAFTTSTSGGRPRFSRWSARSRTRPLSRTARWSSGRCSRSGTPMTSGSTMGSARRRPFFA